MHERLLEEAEALVRSSVRRVSAERLRGQVQVLHWSSVRQAFEDAMNKLRGEVERLTVEMKDKEEADRQAALAAASAAAATGETAEQRAARLEKEVKMLRERLAQFEEACDAFDMIEDFDIGGFEATMEALRERAELVESACAGKGKTVSLAPKINELLPEGRETEKLIAQNLTSMFEGQADMQVFLNLVKLGRKVRLIWQRVASLNEMMDLLQLMAT